MSPDRTTITRAEAVRRRKEDEQKQREKLTQQNVSKPKPAPAPAHTNTPSKPAARLRTSLSATARSANPAMGAQNQRRYDIAMSTPYRNASRMAGTYTKSKTPGFSISLPHVSYGPRWFSLFLAIFCLLDLYFMLNSEFFIVRDATITGNERISAAEIQSVMGAANLPSVYLDPILIENNLLAAFPDLSSAQVEVGLPNTVSVTVVERTPVAAWHQDGQIVWLDADGYAFTPRGQAGAQLIDINADGAPPAPVVVEDPNQVSSAKLFLTGDLLNAIKTLAPDLPQGAAMVFDPQYGLGWSDPRGWKVYFGQANSDAALKLQVYESMLEMLQKKEIQPVMISVEYPNAPYYRVEQ